ncbi:MAG TPA: TonB-dependent receptor, partial [Novosphingobium sp.]|nr:TonB-dependent receptor [Novosphingobium sp.]
RLRLAALVSTALVAFAAQPVLAQAALDDETDIIVTARRFEERLQDVPISITVLSQEQLAARNITNSTELATYTPSLTVNSRYGPDKSSFAIRGFSQDLNTLPTVGVYFAEAVAPRLTSNITSGNGAGVGAMFDLQNVQVLKGPQGTLFGRNTTGGAILLVPRRPTDRLEGYVEGTVGSFDTRRVEAVVNLPLADTFKVRLGVDRHQRDGYIRNRSGIGPSRFGDVDYLAARLSILAEMTPDLENYTVFSWAESDTRGIVTKAAYCNRGTIPGTTGSTASVRALFCGQVDRMANYGFYEVENSHPNPFIKSRTWQVINTTKWDASDTITIKNIASYGEAREKYAFNLSGDNTAFPFVHTNPGPNRSQGQQWTFSEELQVQGRSGDGKLNWQVGGYLEHSSPIGSQEQWTSVLSNCTDVYAFKCSPLFVTSQGRQVPAGSVGVARNNYFYKNYGLYAQATYNFSDQFALTAGIRNTWDRQKVDAENIRVVPGPTGPLAFSCSRAVTPAPNPGADLLVSGACGIGRSFAIRSSDPTWTLDLQYKPNRDIMVYAKYARGYRGGGLNEANIGAESWKPETVDNYELGIKTSFNGAVSGYFNLTGFWNEFKDQQASVFIPQCTAANAGCTAPAFTGINGIQNVGRSRLRGIEADASVLLFDALRLEVGYAYLDAKVTGGSVPFCDNRSFICSAASFLGKGTVLPYAPKHRLTATASYTLPLDEAIGRVSLGATFTHTAKQFSSHASDAAFAAGAIPFNAGLSPALDLVNLNL